MLNSDASRVLVAGGAGFIGANLCRALLDAGHRVVCVDNLVTGRRSNIEALIGDERFEFVLHDVIEPLPSLGPISAVFHLASPASPPGYQVHQIETLRVNSEGTRRLLELTRENSARFLYCSTSEIYGDPLEHPQTERYRGNVSSTGPRSMYDEAKRFGEALTMAEYRMFETNVRIVRIFNTYGPFSDPLDGRMIPNFVTQALANEPVTVYGDGSQTRSLCYVSDLVRGLLAAMASDEMRGGVVNLGNPDEHSILEFARIVIDLAASESQLAFGPVAVGDDPQRRRPDISEARRILQWEPRVGLLEGLAQTVEYFQQETACLYEREVLVTS